jgi:hypothetical protein
MILINVDRDETMMVRGSEHHTFKCSKCPDVSWHLIFIRHNRESDNAPMPAHAAPPIVPDSTTQDAHSGLFKRLAAKLRGTWEMTFSRRVTTKPGRRV